jgi:hypothetical protein
MPLHGLRRVCRYPSIPFSGSEVRSGRLTGIWRMREAREGSPDMWSYLAARSNRRFLVNWSALSARLRQRAAISFRDELSIAAPPQLPPKRCHLCSPSGARKQKARETSLGTTHRLPLGFRLQPQLDQPAYGFGSAQITLSRPGLDGRDGIFRETR